MPVYNSENELIGVTQLINKLNGTFVRSDEEYMKIFNAQAGIALQNARLFDDIQKLQQYQKDMLQSLSDAVIATDEYGGITTINNAAKTILGLEHEVAEKTPIWDVVNHASIKGWVEKTIESGENQYFPDQALTPKESGDGKKKEERNVNITLNPLKDSKGHNYGSLVVLEDISQEKRMKSTLYRYMTQEVADQIMAKQGDEFMKGDRHEVSILFSDIRGYTRLTEKMGAVEIVDLLNEYFERMVEPIFKYRGTVDKFIGDAIMAVFGAPLYIEEHAQFSVRAALGMRESLVQFNKERAAQGKEAIRIGVGISSGEVITGNIGSSKRMDYTAIGDGVNLSARLESITKLYGCDLVISEFTHKFVADEIKSRELDVIRVKGKTQPVRI